MEVTGDAEIPAEPYQVWEALNDPAVLVHAIPGCVEVVRHDATSFGMTLEASVGPFRRRFTGTIAVIERNPPRNHAIRAQGHNRVFGSAWGEARIALAPVASGAATSLRWRVDAATNGLLARFAASVIQATGERMAHQFFRRFAAQVDTSYHPSGQERARRDTRQSGPAT